MPPWKNGCFWADRTFGFCRAKFRGALILLFCFQGGLKNAVRKSGGHFLSSQFFQGGFFRIKDSSGAQQKKIRGACTICLKIQGGLFLSLVLIRKRPPWILKDFYCRSFLWRMNCAKGKTNMTSIKNATHEKLELWIPVVGCTFTFYYQLFHFQPWTKTGQILDIFS